MIKFIENLPNDTIVALGVYYDAGGCSSSDLYNKLSQFIGFPYGYSITAYGSFSAIGIKKENPDLLKYSDGKNSHLKVITTKCFVCAEGIGRSDSLEKNCGCLDGFYEDNDLKSEDCKLCETDADYLRETCRKCKIIIKFLVSLWVFNKVFIFIFEKLLFDQCLTWYSVHIFILFFKNFFKFHVFKF